MRSVVVANSDELEVKEIQKVLGREYNVFAITSPAQMSGMLEKCDSMVLDHNFTGQSGIDFLRQMRGKLSMPVLMLTSPTDQGCAIEGIKAGAYNYLVKTGNHYDLLSLSIKEAIDKFDEREDLKRTIADLKQRVAELEGRLKSMDGETPPEVSSGNRSELLREISARFRAGEVNLPAYPEINTRFRALINEGAGIPQIVDLLRKDAGISSKLISVSNSPFYRGVSENRTLEMAVGRLGLNETRKFVAVISNRALYTTRNKAYRVLLHDLWEHSLSCACAAEAIGKAAGLGQPEEVFTMGLLHDIGKLILLQIVSELEVNGVFKGGVDRADLLKTLEAHHGVFGAALLKKWKFPEIYRQCSLEHHGPEKGNGIPREVRVVHLADLMTRALGYGQAGPEDGDLEDADAAQALGLSGPQILELKGRVEKMMETALSI